MRNLQTAEVRRPLQYPQKNGHEERGDKTRNGIILIGSDLPLPTLIPLSKVGTTCLHGSDLRIST
jgi:hypothetical protein